MLSIFTTFCTKFLLDYLLSLGFKTVETTVLMMPNKISLYCKGMTFSSLEEKNIIIRIITIIILSNNRRVSYDNIVSHTII